MQPPPTARAPGAILTRASNGTRFVAPLALVVSSIATGLVVATDKQVPNPSHIALLVVACAGYATMLVAEQRWGGLGIRLVIAATVVPVLVGVVVIPRFTGDLWSYAMYGRMVAVHHVSPWTHAPAAFPHDPLLQLVGRTWTHTPSVYGPVFTAFSAAGAAIVGAAALPTRLLYQGLAAIALGGGGWLVWRRTRSAAAVAFLTVHPLVVMYLVNGGRNDIVVGVAMLGAVVLASKDRPFAAGIVGALGALVKVIGVVGIAALFVTLLARGERRAAHRMLIAGGSLFALGYAVAGTSALFAPMQTAGALSSRGSPWSIVSLFGFTRPSSHLALAVLAVLVLIVVVRHTKSTSATAVAASLGMLSLAAAYTLPPYAAWGLPAAALDHRSRVARIVAASGVVLVVTYEILRHPFGGVAGSGLHAVATAGGPLALLALVVMLVRTPRAGTGKETLMTSTELAARAPLPALASNTLVVIPTLDEAANISSVLEGVRAALPSAHVLVVDDGSTDGTSERAQALGDELGQIHVLRRHGPRGLGPAYRAGFRAGLANGFEVMVEMDADLSHDPRALPSLLAAVQDGADLAIGSRYVAGGGTPGWPGRRRFLSRAGGWYARTLLRLPVRDVTSGYRAYRAQLLRDIDLDTVTSTGYGFQIEMTHRARQAGAVIDEVPIVFRDRTAGASKMSPAIAREALLMVTRRALRLDGPAAGRPAPAASPAGSTIRISGSAEPDAAHADDDRLAPTGS
ncbi:MAG: dolichol-phosphate mannosyltransferase [Actinomycetota bacterium]|nr:dolichol-phosphate mannosyltransferase [Actinomycetota bacterium]